MVEGLNAFVRKGSNYTRLVNGNKPILGINYCARPDACCWVFTVAGIPQFSVPTWHKKSTPKNAFLVKQRRYSAAGMLT